MPKRHSVERDVTGFCGWPKLLEIVEKAGKIGSRVYSGEFLQALIATLFETGGRISEVLKLKPENFDLEASKEFAIAKMPLVKRKKGTTTPTIRTIPIKRNDPLWPFLERWVKRHKQGERLFQVSRSKAFLLIRSMGRELYPHWFRAQRASQLALEYGWDAGKLSEYFSWKHFPTALRYARLGWKGLAESMK